MSRVRKILIAADQLLGQFLFKGIGIDETISAYCHRRGYTWRVKMIDAIFGKDHCKYSYMNEKNGTQNAPEYRGKV